MFGITNNELEEISISMLAIAFAVLIADVGIMGLFKYPITEIAKQLGVLIITVGTGFIFHEMAHKFVAQRYGAIARFRMWPMGLMMCLIFAIVFGFVLAAPGAVYIYGERITRRQNGIISIAGPITNIILAICFLMLLSAAMFSFGPKSIVSEIAFIGYAVNGILALFNMLPIPPLDGSKVFEWNKGVWLLLGIIAFSVYMGPIFLFG